MSVSRPLDLVFDPTLAFTRFPEDLLLRYAMITAYIFSSAAYVDPFARIWPGLSTTNMTRRIPKYFSTFKALSSISETAS